MSDLAVIFAKLAGVHRQLDAILESNFRNYEGNEILGLFERYVEGRTRLKELLPDLFGDLGEIRDVRVMEDSDGSRRVDRNEVERLVRELDYLFEVRASSHPGEAIQSERVPQCVFLSHGGSTLWREVQAYVEKDLGFPTLELAQEANRGRTLLQKLSEEAERVGFAVIVMTGEDESDVGPPRARENVIHEIGYFQGRLGLDRICVLYEEGTNVPTNIQGLVYIPFPKDLIRAGFGELAREIRAAFPT